MADIKAVLIVLIIFGSIPTLILGLTYLRNKNRERMAIIERGVDPSLFKEEIQSSKHLTMKVGIFLVGIALGIITGSILADYTGAIPEEVAYSSSIFLFGGASLLLSVFIEKKNQKS
jgi:hypothetical protein